MEKLKIISLLFSLIGIIILTFLYSLKKPVTIDICELNKIKDDSYIKIFGIATKVEKGQDINIINLKNSSCSVKVICKCDVETGKNLEIVGKVITYKKNNKIEKEIEVYSLKQK